MNRILHVAALSIAATAQAAEPPATALPSGGHVVRGDASISQQGAQLDITQRSERAVIDWQRFDIGRDAAVDFAQPSSSSIALNRVLSADPSSIFGRLTANGQVFLSNPNGVLFGAGARVDVGGLVATSLDLDPDDFVAGRLRFTGSTGAVVNEGALTAHDGGYIALLAPEVRNEGVLAANFGTVALAGGEAITLGLNDRSLVSVQVEPATIDTLVENRHAIVAEGGRALLTTSATHRLLDGAIPGAHDATAIVADNGTLRLVNVEGSVRAADINVDGGAVGVTRIAGTLDASSSGGRGGNVVVTGDLVHIDAGATLDASGTQGGVILIGGDERGLVPDLRTARGLFVDANASIRANGGGFVETSGGWLDINAIPETGSGGEWLIDPYSITIRATGSDTSVGGGPNWTSIGNGATLLTSSIVSALNAGTNVTISTGAGGAANGDITLIDPIDKSAGVTPATLTLNAHGNLVFTATGDISSSSGALNVTLRSDSDGSGQGYISLQPGSSILTNGGNILLYGGNTALGAVPDPVTDPAGFITTLEATGARSTNSVALGVSSTLNAGGGNIQMRGATTSPSGTGVYIYGGAISTTGTGTIEVYGLSGSGTQARGIQINDSGTSITTADGELRLHGLSRGPGGDTFGVMITNNSALGSTNGHIVLRGATTASTGSNNRGIWLVTSALVSTSGSGDIDMVGRADGNGGFNLGINTLGTTSTVRTTGTGGISLVGYGSPNGTLTNNEGLRLENALVEVQGGADNLTLTGFGGQGTNYNVGVNPLGGVIRMGAAATGSMIVTGTGGGSSLGNWGVLVENNAVYESLGAAPIRFTGFAGTGTNSSGIQHSFGASNRVGSATMTGDITLISDTINLQGDSGATTLRSNGALIIEPYSVGTTIGLGNGSGTLNLNAIELSRFADGFSRITIGRSDGTGAIDVSGATFTDPVHLRNGPVTQSGAIAAPSLLVTSSGAVTLANAANNVGTLAGTSSGAFSFANANALTIGALSDGTTTYNGVVSGGAVTLSAQGATADLTLAQPVVAVGSGTTLQLAAGRNFINDVGASALNAGNGRWLVWSSNPANDTIGGLTNGFRQYDATFGVTTPAQTDGNGLLYRLAPTVSATLAPITRVYDGTTAVTFTPADFVLTGVAQGDEVALTTPSSGTFDTAAAGTGKTVTAAGLSAQFTSGGLPVYGYRFSSSASNANSSITPAPLTITANDASRSAGAPDPEFSSTLSGLRGSDTASVLSGLTYTTTADLNSPAGRYTLTPGGASAANYTLTYVDGTLEVTGGSPTNDTLPRAQNLDTVTTLERSPVLQASTQPSPLTGQSNTRTLVVDGGIAMATPVRQPTSVTGSFVRVEPLPEITGERSQIRYVLPPDTFHHTNPTTAIRITATMPDGSALPQGLTFDAATGVLSGTLPAGVDVLDVVFTATAPMGSEARARTRVRSSN